MLPLTDTQITDALGPYGVRASADLAAGIKTYIELLLKWNKSVSLTTVTNVGDILRFHFGESLFALPMLPVEKSRLADVGSGAGFPGIPLVMARPGLDVKLIEPNAKKFAFLNEVIRQLGLDRVTAIRGRTSDLPTSGERLEVVTARAVGQFDELIAWAKTRITPRGTLILWVGADGASHISKDTRFDWSTPVRIPQSDRRFILTGSASDGESA